MFGYGSYHAGYHTPKVDHHVRLMTLAGARQAPHTPTFASDETRALMLKHWGKGQTTAYHVSPQPWAADTPNDPVKIEELRKSLLKAVDDWEKDTPKPLKPANISFFAEPHISPRLTAGNFPESSNDEPFQHPDEEKQRLKMFFETSRLVAGMVRKELPGRKVMIPWGDPGFVIPLLRASFPTNLIDGSSVDVPNFERLPEQQLYDNTVHRMYELATEYKKVGDHQPRALALRRRVRHDDRQAQRSQIRRLGTHGFVDNVLSAVQTRDARLHLCLADRARGGDRGQLQGEIANDAHSPA
jgi:hypothetical protein